MAEEANSLSDSGHQTGQQCSAGMSLATRVGGRTESGCEPFLNDKNIWRTLRRHILLVAISGTVGAEERNWRSATVMVDDSSDSAEEKDDNKNIDEQCRLSLTNETKQLRKR